MHEHPAAPGRHGSLVECLHAGDAYEAYVAPGRPGGNPRPCVLVLHDWRGQTSDTHDVADRIAGCGYTAVALDVYGKGRRGSDPQSCQALMAPLVADRALLASRLRAGLAFARGLRGIDPARMAAIGHCFGGLCVLDMARRNLGVKAVVSLHGVLSAPPEVFGEPIAASILVLHGDRDPLAPAADETALREELTARRATWEMHAYGHAMHAFTFAGANDPAQGLAYHPLAARRAWNAMTGFLAEQLAPL